MKFITSTTINIATVLFVVLTEGKQLRVDRSLQEEKPIVCSGNGNRYDLEEMDEMAFFGLSPRCHCFSCYEGDNCETLMPMDQCTEDASGVDLGMTKEVIHFPELRITSSYRLDYESWKTIAANDESKPMDYILHKTLTELHKAVGNVKTDGYTLVIGLGSHQLLQAANHALSKNIDQSASVYAQVPYWSKFPRMTNEFAPRTVWVDKAGAEAAEETDSLIEIIVSPSNPANLLHTEQEPIMAPKERQVWDLVYYWPSSFADAEALKLLEEDIMIFSLSKLAGYAAHRFAWAWVSDPVVAEDMANYISTTTQAYPANEMLYSINVLQGILKSVGTENDFFKLVQKELMSRCNQIEEVFADGGGRFKVAVPCGNMYMLVECDGECKPYFDAVGLEVSDGASMGFTGETATNTVRLCYGYEASRFDVILKKLRMLPHNDNAVVAGAVVAGTPVAETVASSDDTPVAVDIAKGVANMVNDIIDKNFGTEPPTAAPTEKEQGIDDIVDTIQDTVNNVINP